MSVFCFQISFVNFARASDAYNGAGYTAEWHFEFSQDTKGYEKYKKNGGTIVDHNYTDEFLHTNEKCEAIRLAQARVGKPLEGRVEVSYDCKSPALISCERKVLEMQKITGFVLYFNWKKDCRSAEITAESLPICACNTLISKPKRAPKELDPNSRQSTDAT